MGEYNAFINPGGKRVHLQMVSSAENKAGAGSIRGRAVGNEVSH